MLKELRIKLAAKEQERTAKAQVRAARQWQEERDNQEERLRLVLGFTGNAHTDIFLAPGKRNFTGQFRGR